jgi:phenylalanine-4-hydroxylase
MTNTPSMATATTQPASKRRLAGRWQPAEVQEVETWLSKSSESPPGGLTSPELGLRPSSFDEAAWEQALKAFKFSAQQRGVKLENFPPFYTEGLGVLRIVQTEPRWCDLARSFKAQAGFSLVLLPSTPSWHLTMAFLAQGVVPVVPYLGELDPQGRVDPLDLRRVVCGFLPLLAGSSDLRDFARVFARTASRTSTPKGTAFLQKLWHATFLSGIVQNGKSFKPFGMELTTDGPNAQWACVNTSTQRRLLTLETLRRAELCDLEARGEKAVVFISSGTDRPHQVLVDFLTS